MKLKTFQIGGIHPPEHKMASGASIQPVPMPEKVVIPVSQHLGRPATVQVKRGDEIKVGQLLAKGESFISADIHSPFSGKVTKVSEEIESSGFRRTAISMDVIGDEWDESIDRSTDIIRECKMSQQEIVERIHQMGVVGLGGATFPSHVKYMVPEGKTLDYLVINGVECEPYLTADHRLMLEHGEEMMIGIEIMMRALGVAKAIIGIENNKPDAIKHLEIIAKDFKGISIVPLKVQYPQGGEKQLIDAVLKRQVPSGKLPLDVGCVVNNVGTAFAIYEAIQKNKPLIERVVTVTGKTVGKPSNFMVRIGTPAISLINMAEGDLEKTGKVINGGPMMGKSITSLDVPVTKGTSGLLLVETDEAKRGNIMNCIRCGKCTTVCPMGLEPHLLAVIANQGLSERCEDNRIMDCIECGSCSYICPSWRPLLDKIRVGKSGVSKMIQKRNKK